MCPLAHLFCFFFSDNLLIAHNTTHQPYLCSHCFIYIENKVNVLSNPGHTWVGAWVASWVQIKIATSLLDWYLNSIEQILFECFEDLQCWVPRAKDERALGGLTTSCVDAEHLLGWVPRVNDEEAVGRPNVMHVDATAHVGRPYVRNRDEFLL